VTRSRASEVVTVEAGTYEGDHVYGLGAEQVREMLVSSFGLEVTSVMGLEPDVGL
jgi:hypothetical protein